MPKYSQAFVTLNTALQAIREIPGTTLAITDVAAFSEFTSRLAATDNFDRFTPIEITAGLEGMIINEETEKEEQK